MDSPDLLGLKESDPNVPDAKKLEPQVPDPKTADSKGKGKAIEPDLHDPKLSDPKGKGKAAHPEVAVPEGVTLEVLPTEKTLGSELADQDVLAQDKPASKVSGSMASDSKASGSKISDAKISHRKASKQKMRDPKVSCPVANPRDYFNCKEVSAETTIRSSWEFAQEVGEPNSLIRVRNIRTCIPLARDAWGRKAQRQPVIVSATAFLRKPFESASAEDAVTDGTVHYGKLSKAIAIASKAFADEAGTGTLDSHEVSLENFLDTTAIALTTMSYPYCETAKCETSEESEESEESGESRESEEIEDIKESENAKESKGIKESEESTKDILLHRAITNALELSIMLPKASLMGSGVSLTTGTVYYIDRPNPVSMCGRLTLHELRIPALIGVNSNERLAKQIVVANVEIDRWVGHVDLYNELEDIVVKASLFLIT